ncbi:NADH dehydrogenase [ubiquinone] 1 alpha subcomplex subunit 9, mitochondrial-like [Corticium candelabrum]|uniref:NADH dehydrogenase [ubiquinone] 1 alpha subcomplex subunit 9, mitochondrial-like n=1 Tax=Corticium candelabrum TaxID=121492 RepID=UPI002E254489|nr:NADH dehydrogenase [ubiquinone] 1 alpha subcomplex subunit 9, mitochondrial-like [Corticium candelabrum]
MASVRKLSLSRQQTISLLRFGSRWRCGRVISPLILKNNLSSLVKTGRGGRSSFSGNHVTIFGSTGFLGRYVVNRLGRMGTSMMLPYRGDELDTRHLKLMGDLGQIEFRRFSLRDEQSVKEMVRYSSIVVNLIGREFNTWHFKMDEAMGEGARTIARACREAGVKQFIHVSALNASGDSPSAFLRAKAAGEAAVLEEFPDATIMQPSWIYGREDRFFNYYANLKILPFPFAGVPFLDRGLKTVKRPVFVVDVATAIFNAIHNDETVGQVYELAGPKEYILFDLVEYLYQVLRRPFKPYSLPRPLYNLVAFAFENSPFDPYLTRDILIRQHLSDQLKAGVPGLEDLNVKPTAVEEAALGILRRHRDALHYNETIDELHAP